MFSRSYLGFIFVNRQQTGDPSFETDQDEFNRVVGLDYTLASKDNKWTGKLYSSSHLDNDDKDTYSAGFRLGYNSRKHHLWRKPYWRKLHLRPRLLAPNWDSKHFLRYGHRFGLT